MCVVPLVVELKAVDLAITNGQQFDQPCLCDEASIKPQKDKVKTASKLVNHVFTCAVPGPKLHGHRSSFVWDLALCISSSGC